jgi:hypothetical protein
VNIRDNPPLSKEDFAASLNRAMEQHAVSEQPIGAQSFFEIVTPDPANAQLRLDIVQAIAAAIGLDWATDVDQSEAFDVVDKAVMPIVDELAARARYMREAAELLSRNVESLAADLDAADSTNRNLHKLLQARDAQVAELTKTSAPEPKVCKCCEAAADLTGFKSGSCAGSPTFPYGCGHSFGSHFGAYLAEVPGE